MSKKKTQTKAGGGSKELTPKQVQAKAMSLLRGIDNSSAVIKQQQASIEGRAKELEGLLITGLSNQTAAKPAKPIQAAKPAPKSAKPAPAKAAKVSAKKAKVSAKKEKPKPEKGANGSNGSGHKPVSGRPTVKDAIREFIKKDGPDTKANLYRKVTGAYGYWSRQSFYQALKDEAAFKTVDDKIQALDVPEPETSDADADKFVQKVAADTSVAAAT